MGVTLTVFALVSCNPGAPGDSAARTAPVAVPGEVIVRLRADFPECAHCVVAGGRRFAAVAGDGTLDELRVRHGIREMEPVFGGVHASERRRATQRRLAGRAAPGSVSLPELSHIYVVRADPGTDPGTLAAGMLRDSDVESAEPNYIYQTAGTPALTDGRAASVSGAGTHGETDKAPAVNSDLPNDPFLRSRGSWGQPFADLWSLFTIEAPAAWQVTQGEGTLVAVVDSGIDVGHRDIRRNIWRNGGEIPLNGVDDDDNGFVDDVHGWDFTRCTSSNFDGSCVKAKAPGRNVHDRWGHGTLVAGIIAATGNNLRGIIGVAPGATIMPVKALDASGRGATSALAAAVVYAAENGASVINASFTGPTNELMRMAVDYASVVGAVVVTAAGNGAVPLQSGASPANVPEALAVGATTESDESASFSNFGGPLALVAPGGGGAQPAADPDPQRSILSLAARNAALGRTCHYEVRCEGDDCPEVRVCARSQFLVSRWYLRERGTSMAAAFVSGVAALVRARHPEYTREQVRQALLQSADDLGPGGWDRTFGYGRVNARRAVSLDALPVAEITEPINGGKVKEWQLPLTVRGSALVPQGRLDAWRLTLRQKGVPAALVTWGGQDEVAAGPLAELGAGVLGRGRRYLLELEVRDVCGNAARDTKEFLVPDPRFAVVPIPEPLAGGYLQRLSADGSRLLLTRSSFRDGTAPWLFDAATNEHLRLSPAFSSFSGWLTGDGRLLSFSGPLPDGTPCGEVGQSAVVYDIDTRTSRCLPPGINVTTAAVDGSGLRMAFTSNENLDGTVATRRRDLFLYDEREGRVRRITRAPAPAFGDTEHEIRDPAIDARGDVVVFDASVPLDPELPFQPDRTRHIFAYDDRTGRIRQLTAPTKEAPDGRCVSLSRDGRVLAFWSSAGLFVGDPGSGDIRRVVEPGLSPGCPQVSGDGTKLAFGAVADLDPAVENEDLNGEVFVLDLEHGGIAQVTDTQAWPGCDRTMFTCGGGVAAINDAGDIFALNRAFNPPNLSLPMLLSSPRVVPLQRPNGPPVFSAPERIAAPVLRTTRLTLAASDPEGDRITFVAQRGPWSSETSIEGFAGYVLDDHGDGSADLQFTPARSDAGQYTLRIGAFDDRGGVTIRDLRLVITVPGG